jgi:O-antigen/teichoic acid export membrane protein
MAGLTIPFRLMFQIPKVRLIRRYAPDLHLSWRRAAVTSARQMASLTFPVFVIQVAGRLQSRTDELVVGSFRPVSDITPYALALRVGGLAQTLADQFVQILLPIASAVHAQDDRAQMRELYLMATRITLAIALPTAGILIALAGPVLGAWVGNSYRPYSYLVVFLALPCCWIRAPRLQDR